MPANTRARSDALQAAARAFIEARGLDVAKQISVGELALEFAAAQGCHLDTAKRHLAKAVRRLRGEAPPAWGGKRDDAGRKPGNARQAALGRAALDYCAQHGIIEHPVSKEHCAAFAEQLGCTGETARRHLVFAVAYQLHGERAVPPGWGGVMRGKLKAES